MRGRPGRPASESAGAPPSRDCRNAAPRRRTHAEILGRWRREQPSAGSWGGARASAVLACSGLSRRGDPLCGSCRAALHRLAPEPGAAVRRARLGAARLLRPGRATSSARSSSGARSASRTRWPLRWRRTTPGPGLRGPLHPRAGSAAPEATPFTRLQPGGRDRGGSSGGADGLGLPTASSDRAPITQVGRDRAERRAGPAGDPPRGRRAGEGASR